MKVTPKIFALMAALAAGSALATSAGTTAGTGIQNKATATWDNPDTAVGGNLSTDSNVVTTIVNAITGFDIVYSDGSADDTSASTPTANYDKVNVLAGETVTTKYTVVNNSNIDSYVVNITADTTGTANTPTSVQYFADDDNDGVADSSTALTSVTLANGGVKRIVQVITIPSGATKGQQYSASPKGTAPAGSTGASAVSFTACNESSNQNTAGTAATNGDLQYTRATIYTPTLTEVPTPPGSPVIIPPTGDPNLPNNPVSPPGTPSDPSDPSTPGYGDPTQTPTPGNPGTSIGVNGNVQTAYPPSGVTTVTFKNQVNNTGAMNDTVKLFPTDNTGNPIGTNNGDGSFTLPDGTVVRFLSSTGAALPLVGGYPTVTAPASGSVSYRIQVSSFPISSTDPVSTTILIGISSGNKAAALGVTADATTTDRIMPPGLLFGDNNSGTPTPGDKGPGNASQWVDPAGSVSAAPVTDAGVNTDATAVFPMLLKNTGEYNDTYTLDNTTVTFATTSGGTATTPVRYYYADGTELTKNSSGQYITKLVSSNSSLTVYAVVDVPSAAAATNGTTGGINPDVVFNQRATANYSGVVVNDTNDEIAVKTVGGVTVNKYQKVGSAPSQVAGEKLNADANPQDTIYYAIVAKNNYNTAVKNFSLKDSLNTNTTFVSVSGSGTGTVIYSTNGTSWSTTAPTTGTDFYVAVDDTATTGLQPGSLASGATLTMNFVVKVK
ncbi:beta strand repeat-containing protein [Deinococcus apachensis]|uniref:beta strand repeat-containing protein n=1 Tax=Deinococcus apachensis TaxID=309886 RepID=UPI00038057A6|nr:hypothetical protein [Deinococcus apachensis]